jgi:hypothetical protein
MLRRPPLLPLVLTAVVLIGCGNRQGAVATDPTSSGPTPHPNQKWDGFPLDLGYPETNGDDGTAVEVKRKPASARFGVCGRTVWDPRHGPARVLGVEFRGEAEDVRGRTLVRYPGVGAAAAAVTAADHAISACPDEPDGQGQGTSHTVLDESLGEQSVAWTDTFYTVRDGEEQHDTGLVVYVLTRVGRTVLLAYEYGEGNGSPSTRSAAVDRATRASEALVERMQRLPEPA